MEEKKVYKNKAYRWNPESIRWFENAASVSDFHEKLSELVLTELEAFLKEKPERICDMGCGLGFLSAKLSERVAEVDGYDLRPQAVKYVNDNAKKLGLGGLKAYQFDFDADTFEGRPYDALVMSFFGDTVENLEKAFSFTDKVVVAIRKDNQKRNFSVSGEKGNWKATEDVMAFLDEKGYRYKLIRTSMDFGQPFVDYSDARAFMVYYDGGEDMAAIDAHLRERLEKSELPGYEFYMKNEKKIAVFIIEKH